MVVLETTPGANGQRGPVVGGCVLAAHRAPALVEGVDHLVPFRLRVGACPASAAQLARGDILDTLDDGQEHGQ